MSLPDPDSLRVISYRSAVVAAEPITIHLDGEETVVLLRPVSSVRLFLAQLIPIGLLSLVTLLLSYGLYDALASGTSSEITTFIALPLAGCVILLVILLKRFVPVARFGRIPIVFRVSRNRLQLHAPMLGKQGSKVWAGKEVLDLSIRHAGAFPLLLRFIRLQVASAHDQIDVLLVPSPGNESLQLLENALRGALGLPQFER